jgi:hypothetical protein
VPRLLRRGLRAGDPGAGERECGACPGLVSRAPLLPPPQVGDRITGGDIYGLVQENTMIEHRIMLPPGARGNITYIAPAGDYSINEEIIEVEFQGQKKVSGGSRVGLGARGEAPGAAVAAAPAASGRALLPQGCSGCGCLAPARAREACEAPRGASSRPAHLAARGSKLLRP